jgi:hypothetical protein
MSELVTGTSIQGFFKALLDEALCRQGVALADATELYVVNLLSEFIVAEKLFSRTEDGKKDHEPLAFLYHQAMQEDREARIRTLRRLGDLSLYKAGFFHSALREELVGPDYYIQMGGNAYGQVADLAPRSGFAHAYRELEHKFRNLVNVLDEISARGLASNGPSGMLKVYESWTRTGSERLERVLVDAGMLPPKDDMPN